MANQPILSGLDPSIVRHRTWWLRQWFLSPSGRYYHRLHARPAFVPGRRFYKRVDPELRGLCRLLHGHGLATTPSCQGHFHGKAHFEIRWDELRHEAAAIARGGLRVTDSETDQTHWFRDSNYRLPWSSFDVFHRDSLDQQSTGYLGILIPHREHSLYERFHSASQSLPAAHIAFGQRAGHLLKAHVMHIFVHPRDAEDCTWRWRLVAEWIRERL